MDVEAVEKRPDIKCGDILKYTTAWFKACRARGDEVNDKDKRFLATGRITGKSPNYQITVVKVNGSYLQNYHHTFVEKSKPPDNPDKVAPTKFPYCVGGKISIPSAGMVVFHCPYCNGTGFERQPDEVEQAQQIKPKEVRPNPNCPKCKGKGEYYFHLPDSVGSPNLVECDCHEPKPSHKHGCEFCGWTGIRLDHLDNTVDCPVCHNKPPKPKPDESRLLSKEKIRQLIFKTEEMLKELSDKPTDYNREEFVTFGKTTLRELLEAQRDLTASIIGFTPEDRDSLAISEGYFRGRNDGLTIARAECQQRMERIKRIALQAITDENEFPGDMPDKLWEKLGGNRDNVTKVMRNTTRLTKNGITDRFIQALKKEEGL